MLINAYGQSEGSEMILDTHIGIFCAYNNVIESIDSGLRLFREIHFNVFMLQMS